MEARDTRRKPTTRRARPAYDPAADIVRGYHLPQATGLSTVTIWRRRRAGQFPEPVRLGEHSVGWRRSDITQWIDDRTGARG